MRILISDMRSFWPHRASSVKYNFEESLALTESPGQIFEDAAEVWVTYDGDRSGYIGHTDLRPVLYVGLRKCSIAMTVKGEKFVRLLLRNLPWTVGSFELYKYFAQIAPIQHAKVAFNRNTGLSKFSGHVLTTAESADIILSQAPHVLEGRTISVTRLSR